MKARRRKDTNMATKLKLYTLYIDIPGGDIFSRGADYYSGLWIAKVRAASIREAYSSWRKSR